MEKKHNSHFLLGLVVGGALVYLLSHEKGRKILKQVSEEGLSSLENFLNEEVVDKVEEPMAEQDEPPLEGTVAPEVEKHRPRPKRHFFRGVKR